MALIVTVLFCLVAVVAEFYLKIWWAISVLLIPSILILIILSRVIAETWKTDPSLSDSAKDMLQRFGHFYYMPYAATSFSNSSFFIRLTAILIIAISWYRSSFMHYDDGFEWYHSLILAIIWFVFGEVQRAFDPRKSLNDESVKSAHAEIVRWIKKKRSKLN